MLLSGLLFCSYSELAWSGLWNENLRGDKQVRCPYRCPASQHQSTEGRYQPSGHCHIDILLLAQAYHLRLSVSVRPAFSYSLSLHLHSSVATCRQKVSCRLDMVFSFLWTCRVVVTSQIMIMLQRSMGYWTTRGYANSRIANSRTGRLADWTSRGLVTSRTRQLVYWTSRGLDNSRMPSATLRA